MKSEKIVFNDDVLVDILARLPPESVSRFKYVSPHWRDLISSPDFVRRYAAAHRDNGGGGRLLAFFQETEESETAKPCNTLPICKKLIRESNIPEHVGGFVSSSGGLILCSRNQITYHVGNPVTGKFVELPPAPEGRCGFLIERDTPVVGPALFSAALICEEEEDDDKNGAPTYSVLRAGIVNTYTKPDDPNTFYIESYSSKTGKWSPMTRLLTSRRISLFNCYPPVVANGVVHWYTYCNRILVYNPKGGDPHLQFIGVPKNKTDRHGWCAVTRTYDDVLWLGLMEKHDFKFYMLPKHYTLPKHGAMEPLDEFVDAKKWVLMEEHGAMEPLDEFVDAKKWVLMEEVSIFTLSRMMKKGLVGCKYKECRVECLIPQSRSEIVAVLRQEEKLFLYNLQRKSLVKVDYSGCYNEECRLNPYLHSSSLSPYLL